MARVSMDGAMLNLVPSRSALLLTLAYTRARYAAWDEDAHPRDERGRFGDSGNFADLTKSGPQLGSNKGGTYTDKTGEKYYVKHYSDPSQAAGEHARVAAGEDVQTVALDLAVQDLALRGIDVEEAKRMASETTFAARLAALEAAVETDDQFTINRLLDE